MAKSDDEEDVSELANDAPKMVQGEDEIVEAEESEVDPNNQDDFASIADFLDSQREANGDSNPSDREGNEADEENSEDEFHAYDSGEDVVPLRRGDEQSESSDAEAEEEVYQDDKKDDNDSLGSLRGGALHVLMMRRPTPYIPDTLVETTEYNFAVASHIPSPLACLSRPMTYSHDEQRRGLKRNKLDDAGNDNNSVKSSSSNEERKRCKIEDDGKSTSKVRFYKA